VIAARVSKTWHGAFVATCHFGLTRAAGHALTLAKRITTGGYRTSSRAFLQGGSMFRRLPEIDGRTVRFTIDGRTASARPGDSVAAALLAAGVVACRLTPVGSAPRGPYCLMGVCFDCLVTIDGIGNCQSCLVPIAEGMRIETQRGARTLATEATKAISQ
jgi:hypothetical protein